MITKAPDPDTGIKISIRNSDSTCQEWDVFLPCDVMVGRNKDCKIHLSDQSVSRQHCRIYFDNTVMIENLSNTNKTYLNDRLLDVPAVLKAGDSIVCGRVTLCVDSIIDLDAEYNERSHSGTVYINV